jgi:predicted transcriptional regulator
MSQPITLPQAMLKRLRKLSEGGRTTPEAIVKRAVTEHLKYEEYRRAEIEAGLADVKAGRVYGKDEFWAQLDKARNERKKAA